jgi:hypothetical protein
MFAALLPSWNLHACHQGLIKPIAEHASQKIYTRAVGQ